MMVSEMAKILTELRELQIKSALSDLEEVRLAFASGDQDRAVRLGGWLRDKLAGLSDDERVEVVRAIQAQLITFSDNLDLTIGEIVGISPPEKSDIMARGSESILKELLDAAEGETGTQQDDSLRAAIRLIAHLDNLAVGRWRNSLRKRFGVSTNTFDIIYGEERAKVDAGKKEPSTRPAETPTISTLNDLGNAQRLVKRHGKDLHYCYPWSCWLVWTGKQWVEDVREEVMRFAKDTARDIFREAAVATDDIASKLIGDHARRSLSENRLNSMIVLAKSEPGIPVLPQQLDVDPWLFNCENGTLCLKTGELHKHRREDLITKMAPVAYDPKAKSELWQRFLSESTNGDSELEGFLSRAIGYSLSGSTIEEKLFFVHGPTATGKSTLLESIKGMMGNYAMTADFEAFLHRHNVGNPRPDIARLAGARFVSSIEVDEGKRMAEGLIKMLTGGDVVTARRLYAAEFEFRPTMKLWLAANQAPKVSDKDTAMWRRILRVPFVHEVPEDKRDPSLKETLCDSKRSGAAILNWAVKGLMVWHKIGLGVPPIVEKATQAYKVEMDPLREFFDMCCLFDDHNAWTNSKALRNSYVAWAKESGERYLIGGKEWGTRLRAEGCTPTAQRNLRGWQGIRLTNGEEFEEQM